MTAFAMLPAGPGSAGDSLGRLMADGAHRPGRAGRHRAAAARCGQTTRPAISTRRPSASSPPTAPTRSWPTRRPRSSRTRSATRSRVTVCCTGCSSTFAGSAARPTSRRTRRQALPPCGAARRCAHCGGASSRRTVASSSPIGRRTRRRSTPICRSSSRATRWRHVYEGWSLPGDTGDLGIDTPDLLPDRTAVHDATIELRVPRSVRSALWCHELLGKPTERVEGDTRVLAWHLADHPARRLEDGVPKMDRNVGVSFSTAEWGGVARALRESIAALDEHDPEIAAWARDAAGPEAGKASRSSREIVGAVVIAAGKALREADPGTLSDYGGGIAAVQAQTARTFLASHDGSRSWLILRSLRELGIPCDLVVAENDPFSADRVLSSALRAVPASAGRRPSAGEPPAGAGRRAHLARTETSGSTPTSRVRPCPPGACRPSSAGAWRCAPTAPSRRSPRSAPSKTSATRSTCASRSTPGATRAERSRSSCADATPRSSRRRSFASSAPSASARLRDVVLAWLPWANVDDGAARVDRGELASEPPRRRERQRLRAARGIEDVAAARNGHASSPVFCSAQRHPIA